MLVAPALQASGALYVPEIILQQAATYAEAGTSDRTRRAYDAQWRRFVAWCEARGAVALPAAPQAVALYLTELAETRKPSTLDLALVAISRAHRIAGHETSPTAHAVVREVRKGIRNTKGAAQERKAALSVAEIRAMTMGLGETPIGLRDRALLLLGFAGGFRRSELVGLDVEDLTFGADGITVTLRRSKTDQEGQGRAVGIPFGSAPETCPVRAVRAWAKLIGDEGPAFRSIDKAGRLGSRLTGRSVARIVKRRAKAAGIDAEKVSGHSLRSGHATSAARAGVPERIIAKQTGHRSMAVLRRYIRDGELFTENSAAGLGL